MTTLRFAIDINAPKEKIWELLWSDAGYRQWTAPFSEGSYAETDWQEGSRIKFLTPSGAGMYSFIKTNTPHKEMVFEHLGEIKDGKEIPKDWGGATESYFLSEEGGKTHLEVAVDTTEDFKDFLNQTFPKALNIVKQLSEQEVVNNLNS